MGDSRTRRMTLAELRDAYDRLENNQQALRDALDLDLSLNTTNAGSISRVERDFQEVEKKLREELSELTNEGHASWDTWLQDASRIEDEAGRLKRKTDIDVERFNHFMCCSFPRIQWKRPLWDWAMWITAVCALALAAMK